MVRRGEIRDISRRALGLLEDCHSRQPRQPSVEQFIDLANGANKLGESLVAFDVANAGLKKHRKSKPLLQCKALALARMGSWEQARDMLCKLRDEAHHEEETLGLLARTYKDHWLRTGDERDLKQAREAYERAYRRDPERYYTGINSATLAFAMGDVAVASWTAKRLRKICTQKLARAIGDKKYWILATIAEASLLLNDVDVAEKFYGDAATLSRNDLGHLGATWRNALILLKFMPPEVRPRIDCALNVPKVAVFTGHRVDGPQRKVARFPGELADDVKKAIRNHLLAANIRVGYSSAASGSDILFIEAIQAVGGHTRIVLPCSREQFLQESVVDSGGDWPRRFQKALKQADDVIIASSERLKFGSIGYDYANKLVHGLAVMQASEFHTELVRLAVWDGQPGDGPGGTADTVRRWQEAGHAVNLINPRFFCGTNRAAELQGSKRRRRVSSASARPDIPGFGSEVCAILFADAFHFSKLAEEQIPNFVLKFMGPIAMLVNEAKPQILYRNTWGDGLFLVFSAVADAGKFAKTLADRVAAIDRKAAGLPEDMSLRISLHAGPVFRFKDQIVDKLNYIGSHVNRAARMEPVTPPGLIYASQGFVALATLEAPGQFQFDYVGRVPLAKGFGDFPIYHLR